MRFWLNGKVVAYASARGVEFGSDVGQCLQRWLQMCQVLDEIVLGVVDEPGCGVTEDSQFVEGGGQLGSLADENVERWRNGLQRVGDRIPLASEGVGQPVEGADTGDEGVAFEHQGFPRRCRGE